MVLGEVRSCEYDCVFHHYKPSGAEWHHPISNKDYGIWLCEAHHSIIMGRRHRYSGEIMVNKTLEQMRRELKTLESRRVIEQGGKPDEIDKH